MAGGRSFSFSRLLPSFQIFCLIIASYSLLSIQSDNFADDPGVGWHLKTGQLVSQSLQVPKYDPFLYSAQPRSWIADQWLSDLLLYQLYDLGSWPLLYAVIFSVFLLVYFGILYPTVARCAGSFMLAACAVLVAFKVAQIHFILRPVVFSFLGFVLVYKVLIGLDTARTPVKENRAARLNLPLRYWVYLPLLFAIWCNLHPAFVLGLVLICLYGAVGLFELLFACCSGEKRSLGAFCHYIVFALLCFLATLLNPYGHKLHQSIIALGRSEYFMNLNFEWLPLTIEEYSGQLFVFLVFVIVAGILLGRKRDWLTPFSFIVLLLFGWQSWQTARILPFFGIVSALPFAHAVRAIGSSWLLRLIPGFSRVVAGFERIELLERRAPRGYGVLLIIVLVVPLWALIKGELLGYRGMLGPSADNFPYQAVDLIMASDQSNEIVVLATPNWGGFLAWRSGGRIRPVIDDRNTLLGEEVYGQFFAVMQAGGGWQRYLSANKVNYVLLERGSERLIEEMEKSGLFKLIKRDQVAVLFEVLAK